jgi:hypothetical protein
MAVIMMWWRKIDAGRWAGEYLTHVQVPSLRRSGKDRGNRARVEVLAHITN